MTYKAARKLKVGEKVTYRGIVFTVDQVSEIHLLSGSLLQITLSRGEDVLQCFTPDLLEHIPDMKPIT